MDIYSSAVGYGFLILIALFFLFFMMNENRGFIPVNVKVRTKIKKQITDKSFKQVSGTSGSLVISSNTAVRLRIIYYSLISLILLNLLILFLSIF